MMEDYYKTGWISSAVLAAAFTAGRHWANSRTCPAEVEGYGIDGAKCLRALDRR